MNDSRTLKKWRLSDFRERIEVYKVTTQTNNNGFPEDTIVRHSCPFAKVERGTQVIPDGDGKHNTETIWNILVKSEVCKPIQLEWKIKINSTPEYLDILSIEAVDIYVNKIVAKAEK